MTQPSDRTRLGVAPVGWAIVFGFGLLGIGAAALLVALAATGGPPLLWAGAAGAAIIGAALLAVGGIRMLRVATGGRPLSSLRGEDAA